MELRKNRLGNPTEYFQSKKYFTMGQGIDFPLLMAYKDTENPAISPYFYFLNGHGDVTYFSDANFTPEEIETYEYNPWGILMTQANKNNLLYTAREFDFETGLYYQRCSYYRPEIGGIKKSYINNFYSFSIISNLNPFISEIDYSYLDFFKVNRVIMLSTKYDYRICAYWDDCWICWLYDDETGKYVGYIAKSGCVAGGAKLK